MSDEEKALLQVANLEKRLDRFESDANATTKDNATQIDKLRDRVQAIATTLALVVGFAALCGVLGSSFLVTVWSAKRKLDTLLRDPINYISQAVIDGVQSATKQINTFRENQEKVFEKNMGHYTIDWTQYPDNSDNSKEYLLGGSTTNPTPQTLGPGPYDVCTLSEVNLNISSPGGQGGCSVTQTNGIWSVDFMHVGNAMVKCRVLCGKIRQSNTRP
jgi:hypothetical protein